MVQSNLIPEILDHPWSRLEFTVSCHPIKSLTKVTTANAIIHGMQKFWETYKESSITRQLIASTPIFLAASSNLQKLDFTVVVKLEEHT